jgi:hypothetical protein
MRTSILFAFGLVATSASCASIIGIKDNPTTVVASGLDTPSSLAVVGGNAYWVDENNNNNNDLYTAPADGSGSAHLALSGTSEVSFSGILTDGTSICGEAGYSSTIGVTCIDLSTGTNTIVASSGSLPPDAPSEATPESIGGVTVHGGNAFWTQDAADTTKTPEVVTEYVSMRGTNDDSSSGTSLYQSTSTNRFGLVVADDTYVYFINGTDLDRVTWTGTVNPQQTPVTLASGLSDVLGLAIDSVNIYAAIGSDDTESLPSSISAVPLAGGSATTLVGNTDIDGFAVDGTFVYWTNSKAGTVSEVSIHGGSTTLLASGQDGPTSMFVDSSALYWINQGSSSFDEYTGVVLRASK